MVVRDTAGPTNTPGLGSTLGAAAFPTNMPGARAEGEIYTSPLYQELKFRALTIVHDYLEKRGFTPDKANGEVVRNEISRAISVVVAGRASPSMPPSASACSTTSSSRSWGSARWSRCWPMPPSTTSSSTAPTGSMSSAAACWSASARGSATKPT
ncbi:hypothetical protein [Oleomonas cavernae]|uniref:hypothetical protein n=1 Tax=Oleomonas cavernae TaxID=2320859 RepID=UPI001F382667|nr:hypothetical protein [Oleomonas cavernae]